MTELDDSAAAPRLARLPGHALPRQAALVAARLRQRPIWDLRLQGQPLRLTWCAQAVPPFTTVLHVRIGAAGFAVLWDDLALTPELAPEVIVGLSEPARRVCLAYVLAEWIEALAAWSKQPVAVVDLHYRRIAEAPATGLALTLESGADGTLRQGCLVPDDAAAWQLLAQLTSHWSDQAPPESPTEDVEWVRFVVGSTLLSQAQCAALRPGWVILVTAPSGAARGVAVVDRAGEALALLAIEPRSVQARKVVEESALKVAVVQDNPEATAQASLDEVAVGLGFEVGGAMVSLSALRALAPGDVLELDRPIEDCTVQIRAGDKTVGTGELLDLDGVLGVRILTLNRRD